MFLMDDGNEPVKQLGPGWTEGSAVIESVGSLADKDAVLWIKETADGVSVRNGGDGNGQEFMAGGWRDGDVVEGAADARIIDGDGGSFSGGVEGRRRDDRGDGLGPAIGGQAAESHGGLMPSQSKVNEMIAEQ